MIFLQCSRASCPFWSLSKTASAFTFFRALPLSVHVCQPMTIQKQGWQVSACHFLLVHFLSSAMPIIPNLFSSLFFFMMANASRVEVTSRQKSACLVCPSGLWWARGLWTVEFVSHCCWGGLKTCCNMAAGQTASGSQSGKPGGKKEDKLKNDSSPHVVCMCGLKYSWWWAVVFSHPEVWVTACNDGRFWGLCYVAKDLRSFQLLLHEWRRSQHDASLRS